MKDSYRVVKALLRTEKGTRQVALNKYFFKVDKSANRIQIKKAIEEIYKVKVEDVNTQIMPSKPRRVRYQLGLVPEWKRAIVTLKEGHAINLA